SGTLNSPAARAIRPVRPVSAVATSGGSNETYVAVPVLQVRSPSPAAAMIATGSASDASTVGILPRIADSLASDASTAPQGRRGGCHSACRGPEASSLQPHLRGPRDLGDRLRAAAAS